MWGCYQSCQALQWKKQWAYFSLSFEYYEVLVRNDCNFSIRAAAAPDCVSWPMHKEHRNAWVAQLKILLRQIFTAVHKNIFSADQHSLALFIPFSFRTRNVPYCVYCSDWAFYMQIYEELIKTCAYQVCLWDITLNFSSVLGQTQFFYPICFKDVIDNLSTRQTERLHVLFTHKNSVCRG